eukprot:sb/3478013/
MNGICSSCQANALTAVLLREARIGSGQCSDIGPRFTGPRYNGTPIYREDKFPPTWEINGISPRYNGHPDLPGKILSPEDPGKSGSDCTLKDYLKSRLRMGKVKT